MCVCPFDSRMGGALLALCLSLSLSGQTRQPGLRLPANYRLIYEQDFTAAEALSQFVVSDPAAWRVAKGTNQPALELYRQSSYQPPVRSPVNIALIADRLFEDFVLEADLLQSGKEYGHRDLCIYFGMTSPTNFYYVHLASAADDHAHNIFIVDGKPRIKIAQRTTAGVQWGHNVWHKVRLERVASKGSIKVYFDDLTTPIMEAENGAFQKGYIGFGSFDDTGMVDNIKIWGPGLETKKVSFFSKAVH